GRVDADMPDGDAQHERDGLAHDALDARKIAGGDQVGRGEPAAAAGENLAKGEILVQVFGADAARGDEPELRIRRGYGLDVFEAAALLCGEELDHLEPVLDGALKVGRAGAARRDGHAAFDAV